MILLFATPSLCYLVTILILVELLALGFYYYLKAYPRTGEEAESPLKPIEPLNRLGQEGVLREIERMQSGGEADDVLLRNLSTEDRALFEISLMEALSKQMDEKQHRLRLTLIRQGYDQQCHRRLIRGNLVDRVRASTLLDLLRLYPQEPAVDEMKETKKIAARA